MNTSKINLFNILLYKGSLPLMIIACFCLLASGIFGHLSPKLMLEMGRSYGGDGFTDSLNALFILFFSIYINQAVYQITLNKYIQNLVVETRTQCYSKWILYHDIQTQKNASSERYPQGEVLAHIINDTESVRELMTSGTFGIILNAFFVTASLVSFVTINDKLGIFLGTFVMVSSITLFWGSKYIREVFHAVRKARGIVQRELANLGGGFKETYYTKHGDYAQKRGQKVFDNFLQKIFRSNFWDAGYYSLAESLYPLMLLFLVLIFPYSAISDAAIVLATIDVIQKSIAPIKDIASKIANVQRAITGIERINAFFGDLSQGYSSPLEAHGKDINFEKLEVRIKYFSYPSAKAEEKRKRPFSLHDITFEGKIGQLYGIVGLSGHGKSTLLNILAGNIVPDDFEITLHTSNDKIFYGHQHKMRENDYRQQVGLVSQDSHIFSESLQFNITLGKRTRREFELFWEHIRQQIPYLSYWDNHLHEKILQKEFSAGQRQLISAVRSCFLRKKIILFDEISSGLDSELEMALRKSIKVFQTLGFVIIVAHRVETIVKSDCILVLEEGTITHTGTHGELEKTSSTYKKFIGELKNEESF